jgi:diguanylate cyclase (GGDEF)-like protein/PAS domain S-box-containing protein
MSKYSPKVSQETLAHIAGRIAHLGAWIADLPSERVYLSDEVCDIHKLPHGTIPSFADAFAFYPPEWRLKIHHAFEACRRDAMPFDQEAQIQTPGGQRVWVRVIGEAVRDEAGAVIQIQGALQDISAPMQAEEQRLRLAARLTATLENITDAFVMLNRNWTFGYLNREAERIMQCRREDVIGRNIWESFPRSVGTRYYVEFLRAMNDNVATSFEEHYKPLDLWTNIRAFPTDEGLAIYFIDISARKAAEAEIRTLAYYDSLTGLPNRQTFLMRLEEALAASRNDHHQRAVLIIDLDNFKSINDTRGHEKGDILLKLVSARLPPAVGASDVVARFGGDEFVILLNDLGQDRSQSMRRVQDSGQRILDTFAPSFDIAGQPEFSSASIGVAMFDGEPVSAEELLKRADLAMYAAKGTGRNAMALFTPAMQARVNQRVALEGDLRQALVNAEFLLHYQPLADVNGQMTGAEALVRWQHPVRGMVLPGVFIPVTEETGLIQGLGHWVLKTACEQLARWARHPGTAHLTMSVNVSAHQFHRPDFVEQVMSLLEQTGADPSRLKLELTESLLIKDLEGTISKMNALKDVGVGFSLDDFGTGYSSLSSLHRLPLNQLKIDQSFVRDALNEQHGAVIARTVLALGKALNLAVLAEGVETSEQYAFIVGAGCQAYQGFLFSHPLPEPQLAEFVRRRLH